MRIMNWLWILLLWPLWSSANPVDAPHIQVGLHSEVRSVQAGQPFWVALRLTPEEHWHTYWQNPGDSGAPPAVQWQLPAGAQAGEIVWPAPQRIPVQHLVNLGYEGEVWLPVQITPPAGFKDDTFSITADFNWLVCEEECIPGDARLSLDLPVSRQTPAIDARWQAGFARARQQFPQALDAQVQLTQSASGLTLALALPSHVAPKESDPVWFLPVANDLLEHAAEQPWSISDGRLLLRLQSSPYFTEWAKQYDGVLLVGNAAYQVRAMTAEKIPDNTRDAVINSAVSGLVSGHLWFVVVLAFTGGLLLNLMPCVLPVLALKALSLLQQREEAATSQRLYGLTYSFGVILSFLLVAGLLLLLRAGGEQIGWGFQLQSPLFVSLLVYLLFVMGLSLSGLVSFGDSWMGWGQSLSQGGGYSGSFFTGVLAVLVASPCSAPFMGTALGYAVTQSTVIALLVFACLGLGMAFPFLLLSFMPRLQRLLPKPGQWMESFKQLMAFPLYATALWLLWVLGRQVGVDGMAVVLGGVLLLSLGLWSCSRSMSTGRWRFAVLVLALLGAVSLLRLPVLSPLEGLVQAGNHDSGKTQAYTPRLLQALRDQNKPVFVNLTADWCITCLVNEQLALSHTAVQQAFKDHGVVYLKGDWTKQDTNITTLLAQYDRNGVPLYLFYPAGREARVLPQVLTPQLVINALNEY